MSDEQTLIAIAELVVAAEAAGWDTDPRNARILATARNALAALVAAFCRTH